jgi:hypothetical protein
MTFHIGTYGDGMTKRSYDRKYSPKKPDNHLSELDYDSKERIFLDLELSTEFNHDIE